MRHIKILGVQDLEKPHFNEYIRAAIAQAAGVQMAAVDVPLAQVREIIR